MNRFGKILSAIGVETDAESPEAQDESKRRDDKIILAWRWLRGEIDKGVDEYLRTGDSQRLQSHVASPAIDALMPHLESFHAGGLLLGQGNEMVRQESVVEIISAELNKQNNPTSFVVRERFHDTAVVSGPGGAQKQAGGEERVIQAKVEVLNGSDYRLLYVLQVSGATL